MTSLTVKVQLLWRITTPVSSTKLASEPHAARRLSRMSACTQQECRERRSAQLCHCQRSIQCSRMCTCVEARTQGTRSGTEATQKTAAQNGWTVLVIVDTMWSPRNTRVLQMGSTQITFAGFTHWQTFCREPDTPWLWH